MNTQELMTRAQKALDHIERTNRDVVEPEETNFLKAVAKGYSSFMTPAGETHVDNIERRYGVNGKGLTPFVHPGSKGARAAEHKGVKVHHGAHGEVFELTPEAKLADVIKSDDKAPVSVDRWLAATLLGDRCEDKAALDYAQEKSVTSGSTGVLLPIGYQADWTDRIRSQMVLAACGMTTVTMNAGQVTSSRIIADPSVGWRAEGGNVNASDPTFELQSLVAKSLAVRTKATAELAQDSPDWGSQLLSVMTKALATEIDRAGIIGSGAASQPRGVANTPGINSIAAVGAPASYSPFVAGLQKLLEANCSLEDIDGNAIMSPRTWANVENLQATDDQPLQRPKALERMAFRPTTSVPNNLGAGANASMAVMGDFSQLVLGVRMEATVEALRLQSFADNLLLEFVGWTRVDFLVRHPASFVVLDGILAAA